MEQIEAIRSTASDAFLTLPLLIIGFVFFLGALTSNVGLLLLFIGQVVVVPSLSFICNEGGPAGFVKKEDGSWGWSIMKGIQWFFSLFFVLSIQSNAVGGGGAYGMISFFLIPLIGQFILHQKNNDVSIMFFLNPVAWYYAWFSKYPTTPRASPTCAMVPNADTNEHYNSPSNWLTHLIFFAGFVLANAVAINNQPVPTVRGGDPVDTAKRNEALQTRVTNRRILVGGIIASLILSITVLTIFRYMRTPCEGSFWYSLIPLTFVGLTGAAWFQFTYLTCGIRPTDILGIVQGMVSPNMIDNPIVCTGV